MTSEEWAHKVKEAVEVESAPYIGIPMNREVIVAKFLFSVAVLHKGFGYGSEDFAALFKAAVDGIEANCEMIRFPKDGLES